MFTTLASHSTNKRGINAQKGGKNVAKNEVEKCVKTR